MSGRCFDQAWALARNPSAELQEHNTGGLRVGRNNLCALHPAGSGSPQEHGPKAVVIGRSTWTPMTYVSIAAHVFNFCGQVRKSLVRGVGVVARDRACT